MKYALIILALVCSGCVMETPKMETPKSYQVEEEVSIEDAYIQLLEQRLIAMAGMDDNPELLLKSIGEVKVMLEECPPSLLSIKGFEDTLVKLYKELCRGELETLIRMGDKTMAEARK